MCGNRMATSWPAAVKPPNHSAGLASSSLDRSVRVATAIALKFQPLGHHLHIEKIDSDRVAARPRETGDLATSQA
jgi:hypothetical protein